LATGETPKDGTVVYNTTDDLDGPGIYVWVTDKWVSLASAAASLGAKTVTGGWLKLKIRLLTRLKI
jgi:hypothetical protein